MAIFGDVTEVTLGAELSQPFVVYAKVIIGDWVMASTPQNFLALKVDKITNGSGNFSMTLFDPTWGEIERAIIEGKGKLSFEYGFVNSDGVIVKKSGLTDGLVTSYSIDFSMRGCTLHITGLISGYEMNTVKVIRSYSGMKIHEIAKQIAEDSGIFGKIVVQPTKTVLSPDNPEESDFVEKNWFQAKETDLQFIIQKLVQFAQPEVGTGAYVVAMFTNKDGIKEFHFHTNTYTEETAQSSGQGAESVPAYTLFKNKNTPVLDFKPQWDMSLTQIMGGTSTWTATFDPTTMRLVSEEATPKTHPSDKDGKSWQDPNIMNKDIMESIKEETAITGQVPDAPASSDQATTQLASTYATRTMGGITANLDIIGDPTVDPLTKIAVIVYVPSGNDGAAGNIHWISGYYRILTITDTIQGGRFVTSFNLVTEGQPPITLV